MATLECYTSILSPDIVSKLKEKNIKSVIDFLHESPENIMVITKLRFKDVLDVQKKLVEIFRKKPCSGLEIYKEITNNYFILTTGISEIDQLIGGLESGHIYEICGLSGSGKTQICLSITAQTSLSGKCVHFIDTKNEFGAKRIFDIFSRKQSLKKEIATSLERIKVTKIFDFYQLINILHWLKNLFAFYHIPLIVIDCISTFYFSFIGSNKPIGVALLNHAACVMKYITSQYHSVIVVTNLATRFFTTSDEKPVSKKSFKPCLGSYWQEVSDMRLDVNRDGNSSCTISVNKNNITGKNCSCHIDLDKI